MSMFKKGLVLWLKAPNNIDISGHGYKLDFLNGPYVSIGMKDNKYSGWYFDGNDDVISINNTDKMIFTSGKLTIGFWIYPLDVGGDGTDKWILYKGYSNNGSFSFRFSSGESGTINCLFVGDSGGIKGAHPKNINTNEWVHITAKIDSELLPMSYVNGKFYDISNSSIVGGITGAHKLQMGFGSGKALHGYIDEIMIYNRSLSSQEISNLYELGRKRLGGYKNYG